jgi:hypothetical protein
MALRLLPRHAHKQRESIHCIQDSACEAHVLERCIKCPNYKDLWEKKSSWVTDFKEEVGVRITEKMRKW